MKKLFIISVLLLSFIAINAQDSDTTLLQKLVEKKVLTQHEADEIMQKNQQSTKNLTTPQKVRDAFNTPYMNFGGYGLLTYKYSDVSNVKNDFKPRVVFVSMNGKLTKTISYMILAEFVDPEIHEFYATWAPSNKFNVKLGQMKVPFTLENQYSLTQLESVYNTRSITSLASMTDDVTKLQNGKNNGGRDIGISISGSLISLKDHDLLEYNMGIFQGAGISSSEKDNHKDFAGQVLLQPIRGLKFGGSVYVGSATYAMPLETEATTHTRDRWALSGEYKSELFSARAEWIHGNDGGIKKEGLYGTVLCYAIPQKLNFFTKVDYFNKNKENNTEVMDYTIGANYYFYKQCRVQVNYAYSDYSKKWDARNSNNVYAQLQIVF